MSKPSESPVVVLPTYRLDSNLVLLPGIIYNVTFSRFKAAALLSRFRHYVGEVSMIRSLIGEYDFDNDQDTHVPVISEKAAQGIKEFHQAQANSSSTEVAAPETGFDWLVLAITPNTQKITNPPSSTAYDPPASPPSCEVVTIVRVVGITDDSNNIKLTLQALTRGLKKYEKEKSHPNEAKVKVDLNANHGLASSTFPALNKKATNLFDVIDKFLSDYQQALKSSNMKILKVNDGKNSGNILCLNPLANALYLQLNGSREVTKAYTSLKKLFSAYTSGNKIDSRSFLRLVDLSCAIVPFPNHQKLNLLNKFKAEDRVKEVNKMMDDLIDVFKNLEVNNNYVNHWFFDEASYIQKANVVASQLKSIRLILEGMSNSKSDKNTQAKPNNQLVRRKNNTKSAGSAIGPKETGDEDEEDDDDDDDDLRAITSFIKSKMPSIQGMSNDTKRLLTKDFKRIKSSPPGNSDFHVIRNYLEIVADIPWDKYITKFKSNQDIDIDFARKQLDEDHYGLEHVKRRLIQYLVVLKLLGITSEAESEKIASEKNTSLGSGGSKDDDDHNTSGRKSDSIVIDNSDLTYKARQEAKNKNKKSRSLTKIELAAQKDLMVSKKNKSPIMMLAGPPGTGKTSLAKSIANSLGRNFQRVSLGGIKDESEIRGHRRTYVGAMPGVIIQSLRKARCMNPVILLDEIDKVIGGNSNANKFNGDPSAALLEVLDPEQNNSFMDHYLGFPVDLSQVIFICTANEPYNLSKPLLDRLEMIEVSAYDYNEKQIIGEKYLLPRQIKRNGFPLLDLVYIDKAVMKKIILDYTREAGVRNFERKLGTICRYKAVEYASSLDSSETYDPTVDEHDLPKYLGVPFPKLSSEISEPVTLAAKYGVVNGLSYNSDGSGSVLIFESIGIISGDKDSNESRTSLHMTGRLGEVLMESAKIGLTFVKSLLHGHLLNVNDSDAEILKRMNHLEIHMHVPLGSILKDGPSAGITMALLFLSLILEKPVPSNIAMTGEITLRGLVLPIGGVKEKILGAHLAGVDKVIVPRENRKDLIEEYCRQINDDTQLNELLKDNERRYNYTRNDPEQYIKQKYNMEVCYAREFWDVVKHVWGDELLMKIDQAKLLEYHL